MQHSKTGRRVLPRGGGLASWVGSSVTGLREEKQNGVYPAWGLMENQHKLKNKNKTHMFCTNFLRLTLRVHVITWNGHLSEEKPREVSFWQIC